MSLRVLLSGDGWSPALCRSVTGMGEQTLPFAGNAAARAVFFAQVLGLRRTETGDETSTVVQIGAPPNLSEALLLRAAEEIMGYFGRIAADALIPRRNMILARAASSELARAAPAASSLRSDMPIDRVETVFCDTSHEGFFLTRSYGLRHPQFQGGQSALLTREVFVATDAAVVLPYDPNNDRVLLIEQFRLGPFGRDDPLPWVLEPVAGRVDAGESPDETARRECEEEADLTLQRLEHVTSHYCSPGCSTEMYHCYIGLCELPEAGQSHGGLETEHEDLRRHVISFDHAMDLVRTGEINIGPLFALLLWLERERPRLRASA